MERSQRLAFDTQCGRSAPASEIEGEEGAIRFRGPSFKMVNKV